MTRRVVRGLAVLAVLVSGCAGPTQSADPEAGPAPLTRPAVVVPAAVLPLVGSWTVEAGDGLVLSDPFTLRVEVAANRIAATSGCRMLIAPLTVDGPADRAVAVAGGPVDAGDHQPACSAELDADEAALAALIGGPMHWQLTGPDRAEVSGDGAGTLSLHRILGPSPTDPGFIADPGLEGSFALSTWADLRDPAVRPSSAGEPTGPPPPLRLVLTFADGRITADASCRTLTGGFRLAAGKLMVEGLTVSADVADCDATLRAFDDRVQEMLVDGPVVERQGDVVSVSSRNTPDFVTVNRVAVPADDAFADREWVLQTWERAGGPTGTTPGGVHAVLRYTDGRLLLTGGCNGASGSAYVSDGHIRVSDLMSTAKGCGSPLEDVDALMLEPFVDEPPTYRIEGETLTVTGAAIILTFRSDG